MDCGDIVCVTRRGYGGLLGVGLSAGEAKGLAAGFGFFDGSRRELEVPVRFIFDDDHIVFAAYGVDFFFALNG